MNLSEILDLPALASSSLAALWRGAIDGINLLWECARQMPLLIVLLILSPIAKRFFRK